MEDLDYRNGTYYTVFKNLSENIILKHCDWIELGIFEFLRQNSNILAGKLKSNFIWTWSYYDNVVM